MTKQLELYGSQYEFVTCTERLTAFVGGIGSGKTLGGAAKGLLYAVPGTLGCVFAPTYTMLRDATLRSYLWLLRGKRYTFNKTEGLLTLGNGAEILFRSADNPERLRGPNLHWVHGDEACLCPEGTLEIMLGRLRADGGARPLWLTTSPRGRSNWVYKRLALFTAFKAKTAENPYLDKEFVASLEMAYVGQFADQELGAEWVTFEGLVYNEFDRSIHVCLMPDFKPQFVVMGIDEGYTNPAVCLTIGLDSDGRAYVLDEFYQRRQLQDRFCDYVVEQCRRWRPRGIYADPSAAGLIAAFSAAGLPVQSADNSVLQGIQKVKSRLTVQGDGKPRLIVTPGCANTIAEFESYVWKTGVKQGELDQAQLPPKEEPVKQNDHALDALRYAIMGVGMTHGIHV